MLNRAAGIGKFIRERIAADCLKFTLGNVQAIGLDAGQLATVIIVESRQIVSIYCYIMLTGSFLFFG
jgi:hypothetical protein